MFGSPILDVASGMAFMYLLLSLIASAVQELVSTLVQARAANLQRGLRSLFSGDELRPGVQLVKQLYDHGLVRGLYQSLDKDFRTCPDAMGAKARLRMFSGFRLWARKLLRINPPGITDQPDFLLLPAYIPARIFALALRDMMNDPKPYGWDSLRNIEANLTKVAAMHPENKAAQALLTLVTDAAGRPERLQANLENWFNDSMDRVSGWYKKYTQNVLLVIGLLLAIAFNVDSLRLGRALWMDKDARVGLAAAANEYIAKHPTQSDLTTSLRTTVDSFDSVAKSSMLPVGWRHPWYEYRSSFREQKYRIIPQLLFALVGWVITAAALSFGAPFWFDTLNKFMVVRGTVKPQEKSKTEGSKD